jgi:hypothetical protein
MAHLRSFSAAVLSRFAKAITFVIHGAPEIAELAVDSHEQLVQMPPTLWVAAHLHDLTRRAMRWIELAIFKNSGRKDWDSMN